jgi:hypothetical protein
MHNIVILIPGDDTVIIGIGDKNGVVIIDDDTPWMFEWLNIMSRTETALSSDTFLFPTCIRIDYK